MKLKSMSLSELLAKPPHISTEAWFDIVGRKRFCETRIRHITEDIEWAMGALDVLSDEKGSTRYISHERKLEKLQKQKKKYNDELSSILETYSLLKEKNVLKGIDT